MCEPATIAYVSAAVLTAAGTIQQGHQAKIQGEFANDVAKYNARVQQNEAVRTRNRGVEEENAHREKVQQLLSRQRVQSAASGVDVGSGSALNLQQDTLVQGEADALRIRSNFEDQAVSREQQADVTLAEGRAKKAGGRSQFKSSLLMAAGTLAGAAATSGLSSKWFTPNSAATQSTTINTGSAFAGYA